MPFPYDNSLHKLAIEFISLLELRQFGKAAECSFELATKFLNLQLATHKDQNQSQASNDQHQDQVLQIENVNEQNKDQALFEAQVSDSIIRTLRAAGTALNAYNSIMQFVESQVKYLK